MKNNCIFVGLVFFTTQLVCMQNLPQLIGMQDLPLEPMRNAQQIIERFNNTFVIFKATDGYFTGPAYAEYSTNPWVGFISARICFESQSNIPATHSLKKFMNIDYFPGFYKRDPESLLFDPFLYNAGLKLRAATEEERIKICTLWCPDDYDLDYEDKETIRIISDKHCCPAIQCCDAKNTSLSATDGC